MSSFKELLCLIAIVVFGLMVGVMVVDWLSSSPVLLGRGVVKQTVYVPATYSHGTGTTLDKNSSTVITHSSTYEEYKAIVTVGSSTFSVDVPADDWGQLCSGATVDVYEYQGRLFGGHFRKFLRLVGEPDR